MKCVITGGYGFLGWHTACRLRALYGAEVVRLGRDELSDEAVLRAHLADAGAVIHIAGVNRAPSVDAVVTGNIRAAEALAAGLEQLDRTLPIVYANSIQAELDNPYGHGKAAAADVLLQASTRISGSFANVLLPNLFGEHGRPGYNSFVATFCAAIAAGESPQITADNEVPLLHAQEAAEVLIQAALSPSEHSLVRPDATRVSVSEVLRILQQMHATYRKGDIPPVARAFDRDLFNTYRSFLFPQEFPRFAQVHSDARGALFETVRSHGGTGQAFVSTTRSGMTRGEHYHLSKIERFFVVSGEAEISLRRLFHNDIVTFRLHGNRPAFVDMPTMWVHNIKNIGDGELVTQFWADQLLDPENPDQYPESVTMEGNA